MHVGLGFHVQNNYFIIHTIMENSPQTKEQLPFIITIRQC